VLCLANSFAKTPTTSFPSFDIGKIRPSFSSLSGTPFSSNRRLIIFGQNFLKACFTISFPLGYFAKSSFFTYNHVVKLQRPHHEMITFAPSPLFFSKSKISLQLIPCSNSVAAHIIPAAHHQTIAILILIVHW
jgi:hypothetical protein